MFLIRRFLHLNIFNTLRQDESIVSFSLKIKLLEQVYGSGLKSIFQLKAHFEITERSLLRALAVSFLSLTNREVSSAKSFAWAFNPLGKSLIQMRKWNGLRIEPWGTPAEIGLHDDVCPFKMTLWNVQLVHKVRLRYS